MRSTAYGTITVWLTGTAAVLLVVLAAHRVVRRVRGEPSPPPDRAPVGPPSRTPPEPSPPDPGPEDVPPVPDGPADATGPRRTGPDDTDARSPTGSPDPSGTGPPRATHGAAAGDSLGRASSLMAVASLVSRVTGFLRQLALVSVLGLGVVNDSYTVANTLPNIVYELLLGGVLTSVMVPLLVRAQTEDADGGEAYTRRLLTVAGAALAARDPRGDARPRRCSPASTSATAPEPANPELATAFAWLLLPQIFFYGLGALLGAILNTRGVFGPFAWAPVLNNVVVLAVLGVFVAVPGRDQPRPRAAERPQAAGARHRHDARHRRAGAGAAAGAAPDRLPLPADVGLGPAARPRPAGSPCGWSATS